MPRPGHAYETILWTSARTAPLIESVLSKMNGAAKPIGLGGSREPAVRDLAKRLECEHDDDLRRLLINRPATYLLLATLDRVPPAALTAALNQGTTILTLEPLAATFEELAPPPREEDETENPRAKIPGVLHHIPAFTRSAGWLSAADPQLVLGSIKNLAMIAASSAADASLFARLHESWRIILELAALPESIDCALQVPPREQPENLRELTGSLTAHARLPDGGSALIELSQSAAPSSPIACDRLLHLVGERGRLRATDLTYQLFDHTGLLLDELNPARPAPPFTFADAVAHHWMQIIDRPALAAQSPRDPAAHEAAALACCLTCLLSARTGQPESPGKLMFAHGWK